ncbi:MAG TPA: serine/threonine-protein kinase [Polyangiaceae bacterium]|nr:serine/threonine-protein kinase [Polyangiaceae bacterium]
MEEVGRGAMGQVVRVNDKKLGREMALKVAQLPRDQMQRDLLARFVEEAQITAQLEHPNVVPVHDLGVSPDGHAYFSMKLVKGQSLDLILEKRRLRDPETLAQFGLRRLLDVFLQVCQGLEYAHARGVIHRDLKPANIMVGDFGEVLVMDWGLAKLLSGEKGVRTSAEQVAIEKEEPSRRDSLMPPPPLTSLAPGVTSVRAGKKAWETQTGLLMGTPAYMSPEQAKGAAVDARTDYYALGVILYEILCGEVPFDDDDPHVIVKRLLTEEPRLPSDIDPTVPGPLETLALRMLEKDQERRTLTITQIRAHVQNYIEGISGDYQGESLLGNVLWVAGAVSLFVFLIWYLTGQSAAKVLTLGPPAVLNAVGWFLLVLALGYPLWAAARALRAIRDEHDIFAPPNADQLFIAGYLAHRTYAAALAPLFQLVFIVELVTVAIARLARGAAHSGEIVQQISAQMRREWSEALIVILVFQFAYLFLLSTEVRFARRVDRYDLLIRRPRWETIWPFFLVIVLLSTVITTDVLGWMAGSGGNWLTFLREEVLTPRLSLIEIVKNLVFQGTFLLGLAVCTMLLAFPVPELLAALRITYQPADEAAVISRAQFFCRAVATARVARAIWLYGGAMIGSLTAITVLGAGSERPLVEKVLYLLGPASIGLIGYATVSRYIRSFLEHAPAVERMLERRRDESSREQWLANMEQLQKAPWRWRLIQLAVPVACLLGYLIWTGTGIHREAIQNLIVPVTTKDWLIILPYALLVPVLLLRDQVQTHMLKRRLTKLDEAEAPLP